MIPDLDIWRAANLLIREHGTDAGLEAVGLADLMLDVGELPRVAGAHLAGADPRPRARAPPSAHASADPSRRIKLGPRAGRLCGACRVCGREPLGSRLSVDSEAEQALDQEQRAPERALGVLSKPTQPWEGHSMQLRTSLFYAPALSAAMVLGSAAMAADLPKEGTYSTTYSTYGTFKAAQVGKDVVLLGWDESGLSVGNGLLDHVTWHCWGLFNTLNGTSQTTGGYCVVTDPNGDQLASQIVGDKWPKEGKSFTGTATWLSGTGKYAGISGNYRYECHHPDFRTAAEGTYVQYCTMQGNYKLP